MKHRRAAQIRRAVLTLLAPGAAMAQVVVSSSDGGALAHRCYVEAVTATKGFTARSSIADCTAALDGGLRQDVRAATYDNRGILYNTAASYSAAFQDFNTAIRLNPELGDAWLNRGVTKIRLKQPEDALADIEKGIALGTSLPQVAYYDRGVAEMQLNRNTEAYLDFKRALAADPNFQAATEALNDFVVVPQPAAAKQN
jgi:tetratricopeptide (TPR) repeat protein